MNHTSEYLSIDQLLKRCSRSFYIALMFVLNCSADHWDGAVAQLQRPNANEHHFIRIKCSEQMMITFYFSVSRAELVGPTASQNSSYVTLKLQVMWLLMIDGEIIITELSLKAVKFWISEYSDNLKNPLWDDFFTGSTNIQRVTVPKTKQLSFKVERLANFAFNNFHF